MSTSSLQRAYIKKQIHNIYKGLKPVIKDAVTDLFTHCQSDLQVGNDRVAYLAVRKFYKLCGLELGDVDALFHSLLFAEDVVTADSAVVIHKESPYAQSIRNLAKKLSFTVQEHEIHKSAWTKDYVVSLGRDVLTPVKADRGDYLTPAFVNTAQNNPALYYGPLRMDEHHKSKSNIPSSSAWMQSSSQLFDQTIFAHKTILEGGNLFCAINKMGKRYYIMGENVISETMAYHNVTREQAIDFALTELDCSLDALLIVPQWTYHLDLQMAYLGHSQFVIHSFKQRDIDFGLSESVCNKVKTTFAFLEQQFEKKIIEQICNLLEANGFDAVKVFGCLFYLEDCTDKTQLQYVPYCKSSDGFDGFLALMMNGIALDLGVRGRHFIVCRSDLLPFKAQYAQSLQRLGISQIHDADMLDAYDYLGEFESMTCGVLGAFSVADVAAFNNGALRCQTSIVSANLLLELNPERVKYRVANTIERYDLRVADPFFKVAPVAKVPAAVAVSVVAEEISLPPLLPLAPLRILPAVILPSVLLPLPLCVAGKAKPLNPKQSGNTEVTFFKHKPSPTLIPESHDDALEMDKENNSGLINL